MRTALIAALVAALGALVAGFVVLLWPVHADGVSGTPVKPHYGRYYVGVTSYAPLPEHPTRAQLRRLGVRLPQDVVERRRRVGGALIAAGLVLAVGAEWSVRRRSA